jgi:diaminopimelate decarboxylase
MLPSVTVPTQKLSKVVSAAKCYLSDDSPCALFFDMDQFKTNIRNVMNAYPSSANSTIAMKSNPMAGCLLVARDLGMGCEVASPCELQHALNLKFDPRKIVFDSPAKTIKDIRKALEKGVCINADNFDELDRIDAILNSHFDGGGSLGLGSCKSQIGVRVNPQSGSGSIGISGTIAKTSKFGLPLTEVSDELMSRFKRYRWLTCVHCHVGSQGCALELLVEGTKATFAFAEAVNDYLFQDREGEDSCRRQVNVLDIGGGLPVDYAHDIAEGGLPETSGAVSPEMFVAALRAVIPDLFNEDRYRITTEYGRYLSAKCGSMLSRVEYTKSAGGRRIAVVHCGADLFLRTAYQPQHWPHRVSAWSNDGIFIDPTQGECCQWDVVGPLCFRGDIVAEDVCLPAGITEACHICVHDAGAYTISMFSKYNSRQAPPVYGYTCGCLNIIQLEVIANGESVEDTLKMWQLPS